MYIKIRNLEFSYQNAKNKTIHDFSINIQKGEIISIFGESGSGKSTILRLIAGLEVPSKGFIEIDNKIIMDEKTFILPEKRGVGMIFQDYALFPHMTVAENIKFGLKNLEKLKCKDRINQVLELVNLQEFKDRYPHELSGGQQQRVSIARALAPNPSVLLLDEPFSNLDSELQIKIREELKNIIKQAGITSIFVTHDREDSKAIADRVILLKEGQIVEEGNPKDIF